ncbi:4-hydroxybenzoate 3-monooxygenase [Ktedonosporobacter rubrisoli]|uniref:4-hydroxybenzoate 3-monooxygenase n=1 Tax=Ktedonosporobacter rubrisoli TaxID=2509675 RepID=A0A4P6K405_KTERU|nr:4-hydroxybenzoate 3-monooxygenase [Ktedonosporobacter rubrisoli]QBD82904.1 4-hydroxybenzoate 3-monooxygenase [Ktedonosporobacter rubrisoli]
MKGFAANEKNRLENATTQTKVGIIGAGPVGLLIGNLLLQAGIACIIVEQQSRDYIEHRARAGLIEYWVVDYLRRYGLADRLLREGAAHARCEFRYRRQRFSLPYASLCGDRTHYVYPQQELVKDLVASFLNAGGDLRFETPALCVSKPATTTPTIHSSTGDIVCDLIVGCDGFYGVTRPSLPSAAFTIFEKQHEFRWLALLAAAPPSTDQIIYGLHERGFAGHMLRTSKVSRFYLQCADSDSLNSWPDERIWSELEIRLSLDEPWSLTRGPILEKSFLDLRSFVCEPMQYGRVYLAGDAAHIISPAGGKGMNLGLADAAVFIHAVRAFYERQDDTFLAAYSQQCLPRIWRAQEFSHWMLSIIHPPAPDRPNATFMHQLQIAQIERLRRSRAAAESFAEDYVGYNMVLE